MVGELEAWFKPTITKKGLFKRHVHVCIYICMYIFPLASVYNQVFLTGYDLQNSIVSITWYVSNMMFKIV